MFSSLFSPFKYTLSVTLKQGILPQDHGSLSFPKKAWGKHLGPEEKGYYNGMSSNVLPILFMRDTASSLIISI